jgi:hypothetical protein
MEPAGRMQQQTLRIPAGGFLTPTLLAALLLMIALDWATRRWRVHDSAAHVLERRRKSSDGFVFEGLVPGGPDKKRSWNTTYVFAASDRIGTK